VILKGFHHPTDGYRTVAVESSGNSGACEAQLSFGNGSGSADRDCCRIVGGCSSDCTEGPMATHGITEDGNIGEDNSHGEDDSGQNPFSAPKPSSTGSHLQPTPVTSMRCIITENESRIETRAVSHGRAARSGLPAGRDNGRLKSETGRRGAR